jgi:hypothetical protein
MARLRVRQNIPAKLHGDDRESVGFFQSILDYEKSLLFVGMSIKWGSTLLPSSDFIFKSGQTVSRTDYPLLWQYAANDAAYSTTTTTVTLPLDAGFIVKAR